MKINNNFKIILRMSYIKEHDNYKSLQFIKIEQLYHVKINMSEILLFFKWIKSITSYQFNMSFMIKTPYPKMRKNYLGKWFQNRDKIYLREEKKGNTCAICFGVMIKDKSIKPCEKCKYKNIHQWCMQEFTKTTGDTRCPMCRNLPKPNNRLENEFYIPGMYFIGQERLNFRRNFDLLYDLPELIDEDDNDNDLPELINEDEIPELEIINEDIELQQGIFNSLR